MWHTREATDILQELESDAAAGLGAESVAERRERFGLNQLVETGQRTVGKILREQLSGAMILLLFVAAGVSLVLTEYKDAVAILAIIVLNTILGFVQDYRAERALAALKQMSAPVVRVRRGGKLLEIPSRELVPGDIALIETGNHAPADCRLIECSNLKVDEAALTGESVAVEKSAESVADPEALIGDRHCMIWMGTTVTYGHGVAVVVETGMSTQLGRIAHSLRTVEAEPTPLQQRLSQLGRSLAVIALVIVAIVFVIGLLRGERPQLMLMTALSLAVAVVPEGLPAVATVSLAIGARRMFQRQALIRRLPAVETLGSVTVICSDKTGTLTQNRMTVTAVQVADHGCLDATPDTLRDFVREQPAAALAMTSAALCGDAETEENDGELTGIGEPTEVALVVAAAHAGLPRRELHRCFPRVAEVPFDSERKRMTTLHRTDCSACDETESCQQITATLELDEGELLALSKGAASRILDACEYVWGTDGPEPITDHWRDRIRTTNDELAGQGMRVLGFALRLVDQLPDSLSEDELEQEMIFTGLVGMIDPPRPEARDAVERCRMAGIRPVMITGDHPLTAGSIARQLGIADSGRTMTGQELSGLEAPDLEPLVDDVTVYARVAPHDKLHIVQALQNQGHVVAMTGDGVNDAPALKQAHIGVAMGQTGTDVSKEASEMVLLDDNFATVVGAVEEGRIVYDNIRKFIRYTMTSNAGEVWTMMLAPFVGMPLPLLPLQILWVNLVTDGLPGLALAGERAERQTMNRPPYPPGEHILGRGMAIDIAWIGLLMGAVSLAMGYWTWRLDPDDEARWRTIIFTVLTLSQMGNVLALRSDEDSLFRIGLFSNRLMVGAIALTFLLQIAIVYVPFLQNIFQTTALSLQEILLCLAFSTIVFWAVELKKWVVARRA